MEGQIEKINLISRAALAFVFFYHGLVSKILFLDNTERIIVEAHHAPLPTETVLFISGFFEILLAIIIFYFRRSLLPIYASIVLLVLLLADTVVFIPSLLTQAFSPITMNGVCIALCFSVIWSNSYLGGSRGAKESGAI